MRLQSGQADLRIRRDELAIRVPARRTGISIQTRLVAKGLDDRHQIHPMVAETAVNGGLGHLVLA
jgi:hypothetical protein